MQFSSYLIFRHDNSAPLPAGKLYVYVAGTGTLASLFDAGSSSIANPVIADSSGKAGFAVANGLYDLQFGNAAGTYLSPRVVNQQFFDLSALPGTVGDSSAGTLAQLVSDFNALLAVLRTGGILIAPAAGAMLAEDGSYILAEDGSHILTE